MEIYRVREKDYDELVSLINYVFSIQNKRDHHTECNIPKMIVKDELHMNRHLAIREDGKIVAAVGIYHLPTVVDGTPLLFATIGNVVTHPDYEGRGYMSALLNAAMEELNRIGADGSWLGGSRHHYNRFGFECVGMEYVFTFTPNNFRHKFKSFRTDLDIVPIARDDQATLKYVWELYSRNAIAVNRLEMPDYQDVYKSLIGWRCRPFLVSKAGRPVGYFSVDAANNMIEWAAEDSNIVCEMLALWQSKVNMEFFIPVAPYQTEILAKFDKLCEYHTIEIPSHFKIINYDKVVGAFLKLKAKCAVLPDGEFILGIEDYGNIKLSVHSGITACEKTSEAPGLTLDKLAATRLLFSSVPSVYDIPANVRAWFPLPLYWNRLDRG